MAVGYAESPSPESSRPSRHWWREARDRRVERLCWAARRLGARPLEGEISAGGWLPTSVRPPNLVLDAAVVSALDEADHETVGAGSGSGGRRRGRAGPRKVGQSPEVTTADKESGPLAPWCRACALRSSSTSVHSGAATCAARRGGRVLGCVGASRPSLPAARLVGRNPKRYGWLCLSRNATECIAYEG